MKADVVATLTEQALADREADLQDTEQALEQTAQTGQESTSSTSTPAPTETNTPTPLPTVVQQVTPRSPATSPRSFILDTSSLAYEGQGYTVGDSFTVNHLERPFTAEDMVYRGYLDIAKANLYRVPPFSVVILFLEKELPEQEDPSYAVELDLDKDGRGDLLVIAQLPPDTSWTTEGVRVLRDADGDVGGDQPLQAEAPSPDWNGYEQEIYNSGRGEDPDLAWIRRSPEFSQQIQIAYKEDLQRSQGFLFGVWADQGVQDPTAFDYNDHWTLEEAGSPLEKITPRILCRRWPWLTAPAGPGLDLSPPVPNRGFVRAISPLTRRAIGSAPDPRTTFTVNREPMSSARSREGITTTVFPAAKRPIRITSLEMEPSSV